VGVGRATGHAQAAADFCVSTPQGDKSIFDVPTHGNYYREAKNDPERCEYFAPINWLQNRPTRECVSGDRSFRKSEYSVQANNTEMALDHRATEAKISKFR
jgi:hypothetical protein